MSGPHLRRLLVGAVVDHLQATLAAGTKVAKASPWPLTERDVPGVYLYVPEERRRGLRPGEGPVETDDGWGPLEREADLMADVCMKTGKDVDDKLEDLTWDVEQALVAVSFAAPHGTATLDYHGMQKFVSAENRVELAVARLQYWLRYRTPRPAPEADGAIPTTVLGNWVPRIGIPHEPDYEPIAEPEA